MEVTRRDLLKHAGAAAAGVAASPLLQGSALAHGDAEEEEEVGHGGEATTRIRRWAMVIDLRACDGCTSLGLPPQCSQYCNWARFVPEGQQWMEAYEQPEGSEHRAPGTPRSFLPAPCMQCQNAPCVNVCPVGATFHTPEGVVLVDQERCIGCRLCMAACPYDRRFFNWGDPVQPPQVQAAPYNVETQVPAMRGTVMKCDFCTDRLAAGGLPSCVEGCPNGSIYMGDLEEDVATNGRRMVRLSDLLAEGGVHRHKEELGTEPRVFYISGHGESTSSDAERGGFMKDRLEWPWRAIVEAMDGAGMEAGHA